MANVNNPIGFQYLTMNKGMPPRTRTYDKQVGTTVAIFQNDVVYMPAGVSGFNAPPIKSFDDSATPGTTIPLGVSLNYGKASTASKHAVIVDRECDFVAQDNDPTTGLVQANMGLNADIDPSSVAGSAPPTGTGFSGMQIDKTGVTSAPGTSNALDLHLLRVFQDANNAPGPHCRVIVKFNKDREGINTAGV